MARSIKGLPKNIKSIRGELFFDKLYKGTRYYVTLGLTDTKGQYKVAETMVLNIVTAMKLGTFNPNDYPLLKKYHSEGKDPSLPTLREQADIWFGYQRIEETTAEKYKGQLAWLTRKLGDHKLDALSRAVVEDAMKSAIDAGGSVGQVNKALQRLKAIVKDAQTEHEDLKNRVQAIKPLKDYKPKEKDPRYFFTLEEVSRLYLKASRDTMKLMIVVGFFSGLRTKELFGLYWSDIDFELKTLNVKRTIDGKKKEYKVGKTAQAIRTIKLHPFAVKALKEAYAVRADEKSVFVSERGRPFWTHSAVDKEFHTLRDSAKVRSLPWKCLRKSFATYKMACKGHVLPQFLHEMGHKEVDVTIAHYASALDYQDIRWEDLPFPVLPSMVSAEAK